MKNEDFTIDKVKIGDHQKRLSAYKVAIRELQRKKNKENSVKEG